MKARLIFHRKHVYRDGVVEMVIWQLPSPESDRPHGLKYRLYYGRKGRRLVSYDNERGKGDHRHIGDEETAYRFVSVDKLIEDYMNDIEALDE